MDKTESLLSGKIESATFTSAGPSVPKQRDSLPILNEHRVFQATMPCPNRPEHSPISTAKVVCVYACVRAVPVEVKGCLRLCPCFCYIDICLCMIVVSNGVCGCLVSVKIKSQMQTSVLWLFLQSAKFRGCEELLSFCLFICSYLSCIISFDARLLSINARGYLSLSVLQLYLPVLEPACVCAFVVVASTDTEGILCWRLSY